ncbi:arsenate reductase/protein-tyrosine-phosphatase family protein [Blastococcus sp. SYSU D00820]
MRILFVCTGNLCRSPIAERLARGAAERLLAESPELARVEIASAGLDTVAGRRMDPHSALALSRLGGDPEGFVSRPFSAEMADDADLVLTMTRDQRRAVLETTPRGLRRTFTLLEAADLVGQVELTGLRTMPLEWRARELGRRLDAVRARRQSRDDDVRDPIGHRSSVHEDVAAVIDRALRPLIPVLFSSVRTHPAVAVPA